MSYRDADPRLVSAAAALLLMPACIRDWSLDAPRPGLDASSNDPDAEHAADASDEPMAVGADGSVDEGADAGPAGGPPGQCGEPVCEHGGTCEVDAGVQSCVCPATFTGARCEVDVDECAGGSACPTEYPCRNLPGGYTCQGELADFPLPTGNVLRAAAEFERSASGKSVLDTLTGLRWQSTLTEGPLGYADAARRCDELELDQQTDYRLPSVLELATLHHGRVANEQYAGASGVYTVDALANPNNLNLWSASRLEPALNRVYYWYPSGTWSAYKSDDQPQPTAAVRCVRTDLVKCVAPPAERFSTSDGMVTDACTGLVWEASASNETVGVEAHANRCAGLGLGGRTWRLPSFLELLSTSDPVRTGGAVAGLLGGPGCYASTTRATGGNGSTEPLPYLLACDVADYDTSEYRATSLARCVSDPE